MNNQYILTECPNCHYELEQYRYCQNCHFKLVSDKEWELSRISIDNEIRKQSLEINICSCKDCCVNTPLFEEILKMRDEQVKRNKVRIAKYKFIEKTSEFFKTLQDIEIGDR